MDLEPKLIKTIILEELRNVIELNSLKNIPKAFDPTVDDNTVVRLTLQPVRKKREYEIKQLENKAIRDFNKLYQSLQPEIRYRFELHLQQRFCKDISLNQVEDMLARIQAANKGYSSPVNKNRKPQ